MNNQRGGFLSKVFIIPAGVALMVGFFFLGYFVGKYQARQSAAGEKPATLPELATQYLPKKEELTFYKTLTEREDKTVSIDLKPKQQEETKADAAGAGPGSGKAAEAPRKKPEKQLEITIDRSAAPKQKNTEAKSRQAPAKKETVIASASGGSVRYTVQIGSYPDRDMAEEEMKRMKKRGYAAFLTASELPEKGTWYRVRLGSFTNKASAEKLAKELRAKEGLSPFVTVE